tara:strand:- start:790 stop:1035 length:246 start_codon:yes stop_codon:yes gene_type:complete
MPTTASLDHTHRDILTALWDYFSPRSGEYFSIRGLTVTTDHTDPDNGPIHWWECDLVDLDGKTIAHVSTPDHYFDPFVEWI